MTHPFVQNTRYIKISVLLKSICLLLILKNKTIISFKIFNMEYLKNNISLPRKDKVSLKGLDCRDVDAKSNDEFCMTDDYNFSTIAGDSRKAMKSEHELKSLLSSSPPLSPIPQDMKNTPMHREPLRFHFVGYTIWLELEEESYNYDLRGTIESIARDLNLQPIPYPHVTAIYGMTHISSQEEILEKWDEVKLKIKNWPDLIPKGFITDVELAGVDGGTMDMAWSEISYKTSDEHEAQLDILDDIFFSGKSFNRPKWLPHLSLAYDNPEESVLSLSHTASIIAKNPSLNERRKVVSMSIWDTNGKMSDWTLLDRFIFDE